MAAEREREAARRRRGRRARRRRCRPAEPIEQPGGAPRTPKPRTLHGPTFFQLSRRLALVVASVSVIGIGAGAAGLIWGHSTDYVGLLAVLALVGAGQALSFELAEVEGSLSVSVVGSLAGAALFDYRAALPLAVTIAVVDWSARRNSLHTVVYNIGTMALSSLAAAGVFSIWSATRQPGRGSSSRRSASPAAPSTSSSTWAC